MKTDEKDPKEAPDLELIQPVEGTHPAATGLGAVGGGTAGAAIGTAMGGPVGTVVGAIVGAVVGGVAGAATTGALDTHEKER